MRSSQSTFFARSRSVGFRRLARGVVLTGLLAALASCGGGSGSGEGFVPSLPVSVSSPSPATTYAIGGSVSGLAGTGLVLQNNASDDLAVNANGGFSFPVPVASGASYVVSVKTQPSGPAQTCAVSNGSGTAVGEVTGVTVACSTPQPQVSTLAGSDAPGSNNGTGTAASFNRPAALTVDVSGNVYVADDVNKLIRKITPAGVVSTLAGSGAAGMADGPAAIASFFGPSAIAVDNASGNVYVGDDNKVRKITPAGVVSTFAGGNPDWVNGTGTAAGFNGATGFAVDASGNIYVADQYSSLIRKITPAAVVTTFAGSGNYGSANGPASTASFRYPTGVAVDTSGNVYVADSNNNMIRKITPAGIVSTLAGSGAAGSANGIGVAASFNRPQGVAVDASGNVYVADGGNVLSPNEGNNLIRKITPAGVVSTLAGSGAMGSADGPGPDASFHTPRGVAVDVSGNVYVADYWNYKVRKITPVAGR
ncbi:NHL repeat-containing protein [Variovorax sp. ZT5P49]|uniref:NHL repeat-containing protein n=1 Tax=Variovorax sp. ZT5P49 TaxID=3443733 RepID=UPI003F46053E